MALLILDIEGDLVMANQLEFQLSTQYDVNANVRYYEVMVTGIQVLEISEEDACGTSCGQSACNGFWFGGRRA